MHLHLMTQTKRGSDEGNAKLDPAKKLKAGSTKAGLTADKGAPGAACSKTDSDNKHPTKEETKEEIDEHGSARSREAKSDTKSISIIVQEVLKKILI